MVSGIKSVLYVSVTKENYLKKREYFRSLKNYAHQKEPLKLSGDNRVLVFFKPIPGGLSLIKAEGETIIIWRLLSDMHKKV